MSEINISDQDILADKALMDNWLALSPDAPTVAKFKPGPGIDKLHLRFDIAALQTALETCLKTQKFLGDLAARFRAIPLTRLQGYTNIQRTTCLATIGCDQIIAMKRLLVKTL